MKKGFIKDERELIRMANEDESIINKGAYKNLMLQVNKLAKHSKGVSQTSQRQYYNHMDQFMRYIADEYGVQNVKNISGKHLASYIQERQSEGKSAGTVKNDLAAVRYYHNQMDKTRYFLPDNKELKEKHDVSLERRMFGGVNRRWNEIEYAAMLNHAVAVNRPEIAQMMNLGREQGLRLHEVVRLNRSDLEKAMRTDLLTVKGKGGLIRDVPLKSHMKDLVKALVNATERGNKVFVPQDKKAHQVIQSVKDFIRNNRDRISCCNERDPDVKMTFHGLRHGYAYQEYTNFINQGLSETDARLAVSKLIGHSREDVTRIYLGEQGDLDE